MLVDGKKIRDDILGELKPKFEKMGGAVLAVVWVGEDPATAKFIAQKRKFAEVAGVELRLFEYEKDITQIELETEMNRLAHDQEIGGIIVQLPLPEKIVATDIIKLIPSEKDVDALGSEARVLSPVVAAVKEILERHKIGFDRKYAVLGRGKLVGQPVAVWLAQNGAKVEVADSHTTDLGAVTKNADVIVSGIGKSGILTGEMIKEGTIIIDAGTNEQAGELRGDADPACALKAALFTPVPGGVGPIVVAEIFKNLFTLITMKS
ncbi:MAG: bifunctional 5,10-methylenetetrahydrofolate dehydrogenase/5,10-methenyltetrahydrofolate cyclohydrolase [Candidatus Vogelbacteria bacterium]|nr:bifunctional 5,10-methylenetetrahydrofolate dehydrogenase/5,10-methenyltetrahydrofolate cyclohydrolase [Candidatus Vogelbacteria bacterium]